MQCPNCKGDLRQIDYRGIALDECIKCKGRWFDRDELRKAKDKTDSDLRWLDFDPFGDTSSNSTVTPSEKQCPKCSITIDSLTYETSRVVIDKCTRCTGVWLDHGEFEKIVDHLEEIIITKSASRYTRDAFRKFLEIAVGPEGTISEIRDFFVVLKLLEMRVAAENPRIADAMIRIYQAWPLR